MRRRSIVLLAAVGVAGVVAVVTEYFRSAIESVEPSVFRADPGCSPPIKRYELHKI